VTDLFLRSLERAWLAAGGRRGQWSPWDAEAQARQAVYLAALDRASPPLLPALDRVLVYVNGVAYGPAPWAFHPESMNTVRVDLAGVLGFPLHPLDAVAVQMPVPFYAPRGYTWGPDEIYVSRFGPRA
jgi:hypothetical protein